MCHNQDSVQPKRLKKRRSLPKFTQIASHRKGVKPRSSRPSHPHPQCCVTACDWWDITTPQDVRGAGPRSDLVQPPPRTEMRGLALRERTGQGSVWAAGGAPSRLGSAHPPISPPVPQKPARALSLLGPGLLSPPLCQLARLPWPGDLQQGSHHRWPLAPSPTHAEVLGTMPPPRLVRQPRQPEPPRVGRGLTHLSSQRFLSLGIACWLVHNFLGKCRAMSEMTPGKSGRGLVWVWSLCPQSPPLAHPSLPPSLLFVSTPSSSVFAFKWRLELQAGASFYIRHARHELWLADNRKDFPSTPIFFKTPGTLGPWCGAKGRLWEEISEAVALDPARMFPPLPDVLTPTTLLSNPDVYHNCALVLNHSAPNFLY